MNRFLTDWGILAGSILSHALILVTGTHAQEHYLTVHAGPIDRSHSVVNFDWPQHIPSSYNFVEDTSGNRMALQYTHSKGWFILPALKAGATQTYKLLEYPEDLPDSISITQNAHSLHFAYGGDPVLTYHFKETPLPRPDIPEIYQRGGYVHPVYTPSGLVITDDYPSNHLHHHGIWTAWTHTMFDGRSPDFWNMGKQTGTVLPTGLDSSWSGPVTSGFRSNHTYVDLTTETPISVLNEQWELTVYAIPQSSQRPYFMFDISVEHTANTDTPLILPMYRYGGLGFRGNWEWNGPEHTFFLTSEGKNRSDGHATTATWCHISGYIQERLTGIAILGHPDNFRAPQPMRIHPSEPFFNWAPSQAGSWSISKGNPFLSTYRFIVLDGEANPSILHRMWEDFASPVEVAITSKP